jgi:hypothetical protein
LNEKWEHVGETGFSSNKAQTPKIIISGSGKITVAYFEDRSVILKEFNSSTNQWNDIGPPINSNTDIKNLSIEISNNETPSVAYLQEFDYEQFTLKIWRLNNESNNWESLSTSFSQPIAINDYSYAIGTNDMPYVVYSEINYEGNTVSADVSLIYYDQTTWVYDSTLNVDGYLSKLQILFNPNGDLYLNLFRGNIDLRKYNFDIKVWETIGPDDWFTISDGFTYSQIQLSPEGILYLLTHYDENEYKYLSIYRLDSSTGQFVTIADYQWGYNFNITPKAPIFVIDSNDFKILYEYQHAMGAGILKINRTTGIAYVMGSQGFSNDLAFEVDVELKKDNTPIVLYSRNKLNSEVVLRQFNSGDSTWEEVNSLGLQDRLNPKFLSVGSSGDIYAYIGDSSNSQLYTVDSNNWIPIVSNGIVEDFDLGPDDKLYSLKEKPIDFFTWNYELYTFQDNEWVSLGLFENNFPFDRNIVPKIKISKDGIPYIFYTDKDDIVRVHRFINGTWEDVGDLDEQNIKGFGVSLDFDSNGMPAIAFRNRIGPTSISVYRLNASSDKWNLLPQNGLPQYNFAASLKIKHSLINSIPIIGYIDYNNHRKLTFKGFNGNKWIDLQSINDNESVSDFDFEIDQENNLILVYASNEAYSLKYKIPDVLNEPPEFQMSQSISYPENNTNILADFIATDDNDTEGNGLIYSFSTLDNGGKDNDKFVLNNQSGILEFIVSPDFENPMDFDENNKYEIQVMVEDSFGAFDILDLVAIVENLEDELPTINCGPEILRYNDEGKCFATIDGLEEGVSWNDDFSNNVDVFFERSDGAELTLTDPYPIGTTIIQWVAYDEAGNASIPCEMVVKIDIRPGSDTSDLCNDSDGDGVSDLYDQCSNTPQDAMINDIGCATIPPGTFSINTISTVCPNKANGSIEIFSSLGFETAYNITLSGNGLNTVENIVTSDNLIFENTQLASGSYVITIYLSELEIVKNFQVEIKDVENLNKKSGILNQTTKTIAYQLEANTLYWLNLNGKTSIETTNENGILEVQISEGKNHIDIRTEKECQGQISEQFDFSNIPLIYPNPATDILWLSNERDASTEIIDLSGKVIWSGKYYNGRGLDVSICPSGVFILNIKPENGNAQSFKFVKK